METAKKIDETEVASASPLITPDTLDGATGGTAVGVDGQAQQQKYKRKHRRGKPKQKYKRAYKRANWRFHSHNNTAYNNNGGGYNKRIGLPPSVQERCNSLVPRNTNKFLMEDHLLHDMPFYPLTPMGRTRDSSFSVDSEDNYFYSLPEDEEEFLTKEFANVYERARVEHLENMSKQELIKECLQIEEQVSSDQGAQRQYQQAIQRLKAEYTVRIRAVEEENQKLRQENLNLRSQLMRSVSDAAAALAAAASPPSAAAPTGAACEPTPMDSSSEDSESDSSSSSSSSSSASSKRSAPNSARSRSCSNSSLSGPEGGGYVYNSWNMDTVENNASLVDGLLPQEDEEERGEVIGGIPVVTTAEEATQLIGTDVTLSNDSTECLIDSKATTSTQK